MIDVTTAAAEQINRLLSDDGKIESHGLRMKVIGGGCSGLQYQLSFDDEVREIDTEIEFGGVRVIVDEKSALYLVGTRLDFVDSLQEMRNEDQIRRKKDHDAWYLRVHACAHVCACVCIPCVCLAI